MCVCYFLGSKNRFEELLQLFSRYQKLCEIVKEKAGKSRASSKAPRSLLSLGFISSLLYALFRYEPPLLCIILRVSVWKHCTTAESVCTIALRVCTWQLSIACICVCNYTYIHTIEGMLCCSVIYIYILASETVCVCV